MRCNVLMVIDFSRRELVGNLLVKHFLEKFGIKVFLCSRFNLAQAYNTFRPAAVVVPNATLHLIQEIWPQAHVFLLPSESGNGQRKAIQGFFMGKDVLKFHTDKIDWVFCWGPKMAVWLEEDGIYREKLLVTGNPATDHHLVQRNSLSSDVSRPIGITTGFLMLNSSQGAKINPFKWLFDSERSGGDGIYYETPYHIENFVFYEAAYARLLGDIVEELAIRRDLPILIRPHPMEVELFYRYFTRISEGRVIVEKKGPISDWLVKISVLVTYLSASALDAAIQRVPVISVRNLINREALAGLPRRLHYDYEDFFWQADNLETLGELCRESREGRLPVSPHLEELKAFIRDHFLIPRDKLAALSIAEEIKKVLERGRKKTRFSPIGPEQAYPFYRRMLRGIFPNIDLIWFYLYSLSPGNMDIGFTYLPWRIKESREASRSTDRIIQYH